MARCTVESLCCSSCWVFWERRGSVARPRRALSRLSSLSRSHPSLPAIPPPPPPFPPSIRPSQRPLKQQSNKQTKNSKQNKTKDLVAHLPRPRNKTGVNLLGGDAATGGAVGGIRPPVKKDKKAKKGASSLSAASLLGRPREIVPFLRPGVGVAMVDHFQAYPRGGIPAPLAPHALLTSDGAGLLPWLWFDDFWQLRDGMHPLNASWVGGGPALTAAASGGEEGDADAAAAAAAEPAPPLMLPPLRGNMTEALEHASAPLVALHLPATAPASASASDADADADADDDDPDAPPATEEGRAALEALRARVLAGDVPAATLFLSLAPLSFWRMQIFTQMEASFKMQVGAGLSQEGESDDIKRIFLEGNPFLLAITMAVSLLHSVFDFLAFKNDIGFWRENKSLEGLSARSVLLNAFSQLVIFLYLLDNDTSMVVLLSAGAGTAIEFWKITKAFDVELRPLGSFPPLTIRDRASYGRSDTRKHDEVAMRYLSYVLLPLVAGYSIYALVYESHRSWYSWALGSLVGAVYAFGFILMCPQLYLNYKLQSVAHLPWRQMTYKFLNTIIDDLFAFVIKMPLLHRLSVFRDDVVFLVYLYQRWIYRVDPKRANEFGFSAEDLERREREAAEKLLAAGAGGGAAAIAAAPAPAVTEGEGAAVASGSAAATATAGAGVAVRRRKPAAGDEDGEEEEQEEQQPGEKKDR